MLPSGLSKPDTVIHIPIYYYIIECTGTSYNLSYIYLDENANTFMSVNVGIGDIDTHKLVG